MKTRIILTGIVAALLAAPLVALAADLPQPGYNGPAYKAPAYVEPAYANWTGFYVGINGGYGFGKSDWDSPAVSPSPKGPLAGLTLGYNFQTGIWVWGVEGDVDWSDMKDNPTCALGNCETENSWFSTIRGRIGYGGWHNWLPYFTAGMAVGDVKASSAVGDASKTQLGWTAGLGVEYAWRTNWSVKLEYLYADLGKFDCGIACGAASDDVSFKANIMRVGLNYRF
jgi:outer membrane immunogenic protein